MVAPHKVCPRCGQRAVLDMPACGRCGHQYRTGFRTQVVAPRTPQNGGCIVCGNAQVQKVSAIYQAGTWNSVAVGETVGYGMGMDGGGAVFGGESVSHVSGGTRLASVLAPPVQPPMQELAEFLVAWLLGLGAFCIAIFSIPPFSASYSPMALLFAALCAAGSVLAAQVGCWRKQQYQGFYERAVTGWREASEIWNRLYYCPRCDHVYDPTTGKSAPSQQTSSLLNGF